MRLKLPVNVLDILLEPDRVLQQAMEHQVVVLVFQSVHEVILNNNSVHLEHRQRQSIVRQILKMSRSRLL